MNDFHPDIDHARQFLALLDSDPASFTFQVIPERGGCKTKPMISHGSIDDLADRLFEANKAGAGVFFMVNAGDKKGRCAENVQRVRAHFVDLDTPGVDPLFTAEIPPHIVVESSANKWHAYWLAEAGLLLMSFPHFSVRWQSALWVTPSCVTLPGSCVCRASTTRRRTANPS